MKLFVKISFAVLLVAFVSCEDVKIEHIANEAPESVSQVWYKQANVDLGKRIQMFDENSGIAISSGKGEDVPGHAYMFNGTKWEEIMSFEYSDYPICARYNEYEFWFIIHETFRGFYKPHHYSYNTETKEITEIKLPVVMWDATDHVMWKDLHVTGNGTAWMVGQKGSILYYNGRIWEKIESPLSDEPESNLLKDDLNSVWISEAGEDGWAAGRSGNIIKMALGKWTQVDSPVDVELFDIGMINDGEGYIVGSRGTILAMRGNSWVNTESEIRANLNAISVVDAQNIFITGSQSTLIRKSGDGWFEIEDVRIFEDTFLDLSIVKETHGRFEFWIIGFDGIYTTSQSTGFSFTDVTSRVSLPREGVGGLFFDENNDNYPDLFLLGENSPSTFYRNFEGMMFNEQVIDESAEQIRNTKAAALCDLNDDGNYDVFQFQDDVNKSVLFGSGNGNFENKTDFSRIDLNFINTETTVNSIKPADFNNDGYLDLYVTNYNEKDMLFANDGTGRFSNVYDSSGITKILNNRTHGALLSDLNNDMLVDLVLVYRLSFDNKPVQIFLNEGNYSFRQIDTDSTFDVGLNPSTHSAIINDFTNDGFPDIMLFVNERGLRLFKNDGNAQFKNISEHCGLLTEIFHPEPVNGILNAADVNNDGYLDVFAGSKLFLNSAGAKFTEVQDQVGLEFFGNPAFVDYDFDGDMDLFIGSSRLSSGAGDRTAFFRNNSTNNNFVKLKLYGDFDNSFCIGAKVSLIGYDSSNNEAYRLTRETGLGDSPMLTQNYSPLHFGLSTLPYHKIMIEFTSGSTKEIDSVKKGSLIEVYQSSVLKHNAVVFWKTWKRKLLTMNIPAELIKLAVFALLILIAVIIGKKTRARKLITKWYVLLPVIFIYFLLLYLLPVDELWMSGIVTVAIPSLLIGMFIYAVDRRIERRDSKYISHYKLINIIGMGGMGKVFRAWDTSSKREVTLKIINPTVLKDEENKKRLASEGELLSSFNHPNIVKVFEMGKTEQHTFIAMEYLTGGTLDELIENEFPLENEKVVSILLQICEGLEAIHSKQVIHRDLKSANIMFDEEGNVRIMDFGLSKSPLVSTMTSLGTVVGTLGYVAPEQVTNTEVDHRTDIFSLGVIIYQLLTNDLPFKGENEIAVIHSIFNTTPDKPTELNPDAPRQFNRIVLKCLDKNPGNRFATVTDIKKEIMKITF